MHPFASLVIRSVLTCYAVWGTTLVVDLAVCETRSPGRCAAQRTELSGATKTIPATLLAWLADSPLKDKYSSKDSGQEQTGVTS